MEGRSKMSEPNQENENPQSEPVATEPVQENQSVQEQPSTSIKAVVVSEHCGYCQSLKDRLQQKGLLDKVQFINVDSEEGKKIAEEAGILGVPTCVIITKEGNTKQCSDNEFKKLIEEGI